MLDKLKYLKDGDEWESWIDKFYRLRYQKDGYQNVPAEYKGDGGIEGYTKTGIVYQCYCPEKIYTNNELWEHQRDKVTKDIDKLINNGDILRKIGINNKIKEWHFITPEYKDKRILEHCTKKRDKVKSLNLNHIDDNFDIIIKIADDFLEEVYKLAFLNSDKIDITLKEEDIPDWKKCPSEKLENIRNKLTKIINPENNSDKYEEMVSVIAKYYVKGIEIKSDIQDTIPELYEKIFSIDNTYKRDLEIECLMNFDSSLNTKIFKGTLEKLDKDLEKYMGNILNPQSISELKFDLLSAWIADCPMDFA